MTTTTRSTSDVDVDADDTGSAAGDLMGFEDDDYDTSDAGSTAGDLMGFEDDAEVDTTFDDDGGDTGVEDALDAMENFDI
jgi:hypothetical protein